MIHVVPVNDTRPHEDSSACWCHPSVDFDLPEPVAVHNSADGREYVEQANAIIDGPANDVDLPRTPPRVTGGGPLAGLEA